MEKYLLKSKKLFYYFYLAFCVLLVLLLNIIKEELATGLSRV